jgi:hypothetical protein
MTPEEAREIIDVKLTESGWIFQNSDEVNRSVGLEVAVREFKLKVNHGYTNYRLFTDRIDIDGSRRNRLIGGWTEVRMTYKRGVRNNECFSG